MVRLAAAYDQSGKPDEASRRSTKVLAMPNLNPAIKSSPTAEGIARRTAKNGKK